MRRSRKIVFIILSVTALLLAWMVWYKYEYSKGKAEAFQTSSTNMDRSLLIATQKSPFKDSVTQLIVKHFKQDSIFVKVIDISKI